MELHLPYAVAQSHDQHQLMGASGGGNGVIVSTFAIPAFRDSSPVCKAILPQSPILSF